MDLDVSVKTTGNETLLTVRQDGYQSGAEWDWYYQAVLGLAGGYPASQEVL
jgi:hypothetical protein